MIENILDGMRKVSKAFEVFGDLIPSPPHSEIQGNSLCVNCRYQVSTIVADMPDPLLSLRSEAVALLKIIVASGIVTSIQSVCYSAFIPCQEDFHRIYRYNILASDLPVEAVRIDADYVKCHAYSEIVNDRLLKEMRQK